MALPKSFTTVTTFSKLLAMFLFILFPFVGFYAGIEYQKKIRLPILINNQILSDQPTPSPTPPPGCYYGPVAPVLCTQDHPGCGRNIKPPLICNTITPSEKDIEALKKLKMCPHLVYKNPEGKTCSYSGPNCDLTCN